MESKTLISIIEKEIYEKYKTKTNFSKKLNFTKQNFNYFLKRIEEENISIKELKKITGYLDLDTVVKLRRKN